MLFQLVDIVTDNLFSFFHKPLIIREFILRLQFCLKFKKKKIWMMIFIYLSFLMQELLEFLKNLTGPRKWKYQRFGSISFWRGSGSGSLDPHLGKVDPDPRIHLSVMMDPDADPRIHICKKGIRIRIRVPIFHIFHKEIHVGQITMLI